MALKDEATRAAEAEADAGIAELERLRIYLSEQLIAAVRAIHTDDAGNIDPASLGNLALVRAQVLKALEELGSRQSVSVLERRCAAAARAAAQALIHGSDALDTEFRPDVGGAVSLAMSGRAREIADAFDLARDRVVDAILAATTSGAPLDTLTRAVADESGIAISKAEAVVETAAVSAGRAVAFSLAERANANAGGDEGATFVLRYVGPRDRKNRPFCRALVGKCATVDAVKAMDNGQGLPVETCGGGYRCRHGWAPILLEEARQRGYEIIE